MARGGGYPIEEFLESITAQLDRTQDALRLKAVNRPLTFALKDFTVDLQVFVEMDAAGKVRFRPAQPNETGASTVNLSFTTITRPMIEENTVSLEMTQAPTLSELGLEDGEKKELEKLGVRNAAQLRNLERQAGEDTLSRYSGVNLGRIRTALDLSRPRVSVIDTDDGAEEPQWPPGAMPPVQTSPAPHHPAPVDPAPVDPGPPVQTAPVPDPYPVDEPKPDTGPRIPGRPIFDRPILDRPGLDGIRNPVHPGPKAPDPIAPPTRTPLAPNGGLLADRIRREKGGPVGGGGAAAPRATPPQADGVIRLKPGSRRVNLKGHNLIDGPRKPRAALDGRPLPVLGATGASVSFGLPEDVTPGNLDIELPDGRQTRYWLDTDGEG